MKIRPSLARHGYLALLITPTMLLAQERPVTQFDTITVTATRSEQWLDEVPSTVTVHDEQQVDQQNINDIRDLVRYEPGYRWAAPAAVSACPASASAVSAATGY